MEINPSKIKTILATGILGIFSLVVFGLIWFFFSGPQTPVGVGWYLFSFASGLTMIVLPCTLPLAFVIVPLSMGKGALRGVGIALAFGLGVALMLSMYGVVAAIVGEVAIGTLGAPLEVVKNWLYLIAGIFAYLFALGEIGLLKFHMPTYTGAAPAFIQKQQDFFKALLLGLFLGNIGVGCPHPATPVILTRIAASGDVFYGWLLFFTHAAGRILPLILLALLAILGVNALNWLVARKEKIERATGWGMVFVAGFILVLGLFTHDWWVYSGQHTLLESITQEERFLGIVSERIGVLAPHTHEIPTGRGLFDLPLWLGNWVLVLLWVVPLWWYYVKKLQIKNQKLRIDSREVEAETETKVIPYRFWLFWAISLLLALTFIWILPDRFLNHTDRSVDMHEEVGLHMEGIMMEMDNHAAIYHEEQDIQDGLAVNLKVKPSLTRVGEETHLEFLVNEKPFNIPIGAKYLQLEHEKLMHIIGVRSDLNEFLHIHPEATTSPGLFSAFYTFAQPGRYKIWSEIKKDGLDHTFGHPEISVEGEGAREKKEVNFGRNVIVGNYQVSLKIDEPVVKGKEKDLLFDIHTLAGQEVEVENYLGAQMHLTIIKDDWKQFIHTHPENHSNDLDFGYFDINVAKAHGVVEEPMMGAREGETTNFRVIFPEAGLYKMFSQFRPSDIDLPPDEALTASFWIEVTEKAPPVLSDWWRNLLVSVFLIIILSWVVNKFLKIKT